MFKYYSRWYIQISITSEFINPNYSPYGIVTTDARFLVRPIVALLPGQWIISVRNMALCDMAFHWLNAWLYFPSFYVGTRHGKIWKCTKCTDANGQASRTARRYSSKEAVNIIRYIEKFKQYDNFWQNSQVSNFMKILSVVLKLLYVHRQRYTRYERFKQACRRDSYAPK